MNLARPLWLPLARLGVAASLAVAGCRDHSPAPDERGWAEWTLQQALPAKPGAIFYNGPAQALLGQFRPNLVRDEAHSRSFAQAVQSPELFRQLDRQERFDRLLLAGDPSQYRPLLEHLLETADWRLSYLDHQCLAFQRQSPGEWRSEQLQPLREKLQTAPRSYRARCWAAVAVKLVALRQLPLAKTILAEALEADSDQAEPWSAQSSYRRALGDWTGGVESAQKALKIDGSSPAALGCMAQALYAQKRFEEAFAVSTQLLRLLPDDPAILFYHAKIAHEARHFESEVEALRHLIALAEKEGRSASSYRVYLGQALGTSGEGEQALQEFALALSDRELPPEQRRYAEECQDRLKARLKP